MLVQDVDASRRRMVEPRRPVEFAEAGLDGDLDFVFAVTLREGVGVGSQGLEAAVERRAVDLVDRRVDFKKVRGELFGLLDAVGG